MSVGVQRVMDETVCCRRGKGHLTLSCEKGSPIFIEHLFKMLAHLIPHKTSEAKLSTSDFYTRKVTLRRE